MAVVTSRESGERGEGAKREAREGSRPRKALTIGAVAKILTQEFDDISISKIRYLEDQKLLAPRRTPGRLSPLLARRTSSASRRSCACSATSSCRCG